MNVLKIFVAALLLVFASVANAETITYRAEGTIAGILGDPDFDIGCSIEIGDRFTTCVTVQADAEDENTDPDIGRYDQDSSEYVVGSCRFEGKSGHLTVWNNDGPRDSLDHISDFNVSEFEELESVNGFMVLHDYTATMLSSDALPLSDTNFNLTIYREAIINLRTWGGDGLSVGSSILKTPYIDSVPCGATIEELLGELMAFVVTLNLQVGVSNSLDIKLQLILDTLADIQGNNISSAVARIEAFIHEVEVLSGTNISVEDANYMIEIAQQILDLLLEMIQ